MHHPCSGLVSSSSFTALAVTYLQYWDCKLGFPLVFSFSFSADSSAARCYLCRLFYMVSSILCCFCWDHRPVTVFVFSYKMPHFLPHKICTSLCLFVYHQAPYKAPACEDKHDLNMLADPCLMRAGQLGDWMCYNPRAEQHYGPFPPPHRDRKRWKL